MNARIIDTRKILKFVHINFGTYHPFIVKNEIGYKNLLHFSSLSHLNNFKNVGIKLEQIDQYSEGLFCILGGEYNPLLILHEQNKKIEMLSISISTLCRNSTNSESMFKSFVKMI